MFSKRSQSLPRATAYSPEQPNLSYQHTQAQSLLFNRLPAELRNQIYTQVFATEDSLNVPAQPSSPSPHPLSLLLTCRRINHEATTLAFSTYTFPIGFNIRSTYLSLQNAVSHLSTIQVKAIRSLSVLSGTDAGAFLSNALLVFPHLQRFVIETDRRKGNERIWIPGLQWHQPQHSTSSATNMPEDANLCLQAVDKYAPYWLVQIIQDIVGGRAYAWQNGSKWTAQWPQLENELCYSKIQCDQAGLREEIFMDADAVDTVPGVRMCMCGCKNVSWTAATLRQERGRAVSIEVMYCSKGEEERETQIPEVVLIPGTAPSAQAIVRSCDIRYEPDEEYWDAFRRKNRNIDALCWDLWRRAVRLFTSVVPVGPDDKVSHESVPPTDSDT